MKYALVFVTHGAATTMPETLLTFDRWVTPRPTIRLAVVDGADGAHPIMQPGAPWHVTHLRPQEGFCGACRAGWEAATETLMMEDADYVFWLEHDFRFYRPVNLTHLATVLDHHQRLAQMALMRQPQNDAEIKAGGVIEARPDAMWVRQPGWIEHQEFFTTNPSLIPARTFGHDWPDGDRCEGRFGIQLREAGMAFGYWGTGEPWVEHIGARDETGKGY